MVAIQYTVQEPKTPVLPFRQRKLNPLRKYFNHLVIFIIIQMRRKITVMWEWPREERRRERKVREKMGFLRAES